MRLIFCGTPSFAVPSLERLVEAGFEVPLVVTQPDRPRGRGLEMVPTAVKAAALARGLRVIQPEKIKNNETFRATLEALRPDAIVVVGYGRIIPPWMLTLPKYGNINLHASLLPKYRGAAPIQWAIASGESISGNTTMLLNEGLDTGDVLLQEELPILAQDTALTYGPRLAEAGSHLLVRTLRGLEAGTVKAMPQDHTRATLAPILKKEDGRIDFQRSAAETVNRLRGFQPWPGAFTTFRGKSLNIHKAEPVNETAAAGLLSLAGDRLLAGCANGTALNILELQPEGKKRMSARDFANGHRITVPEPLGQ